jgi:hypothetical protein
MAPGLQSSAGVGDAPERRVSPHGLERTSSPGRYRTAAQIHEWPTDTLPRATTAGTLPPWT